MPELRLCASSAEPCWRQVICMTLQFIFSPQNTIDTFSTLFSALLMSRHLTIHSIPIVSPHLQLQTTFFGARSRFSFWILLSCLQLAYCMLPNGCRLFCLSPSDSHRLTLPSLLKTHLALTTAHIPLPCPEAHLSSACPV